MFIACDFSLSQIYLSKKHAYRITNSAKLGIQSPVIDENKENNRKEIMFRHWFVRVNNDALTYL